jgi:hypothetical protein
VPLGPAVYLHRLLVAERKTNHRASSRSSRTFTPARCARRRMARRDRHRHQGRGDGAARNRAGGVRAIGPHVGRNRAALRGQRLPTIGYTGASRHAQEYHAVLSRATPPDGFEEFVKRASRSADKDLAWISPCGISRPRSAKRRSRRDCARRSNGCAKLETGKNRGLAVGGSHRGDHAGIPARHRRSPFVVENAGTNLQGDREKNLGLAREPFGSGHHSGGSQAHKHPWVARVTLR